MGVGQELPIPEATPLLGCLQIAQTTAGSLPNGQTNPCDFSALRTRWAVASFLRWERA